MRRPSWTLWRHYSLDLLSLTALSAGVLVTVIAFAGAIKPMSDGLLAAGDALKYILFAVPPMLAYALPFAGGFASTLVYHRVATDLEATAAYASGVSHRALLTPALTLALLCTAALTALNEQVIPRFLEQMQRLVTVDVARLIAQRVEKGDAVIFKGLMVHADKVQRIAPPKDSGVIDQLLLLGFAAVMHENDVPTREVTAEVAKVWLVPDDTEGGGGDDGSTRVLVKLENVVGVLPDKGLFAAGQIDDLTWSVPNAFRDNVKFLTSGELSGLIDHPERLNWVDSRRRALAGAITRRRTAELIEQDARTTGTVKLVDRRGLPLEIRGARLARDGARWVLTPAPGSDSVRVSLTRLRPAGADGREVATPGVLDARGAVLATEAGAEAAVQAPAFRLELDHPRSREEGSAASSELPSLVIGGLGYAASPLRDYLSKGSRDLLSSAEPWAGGPGADADVQRATADLRDRVKRLERDILSKRHERLALAASCLVMVLTGAVTALQLSRKQPLAVYLFTFFPALACMITISGGQQVTVKQGPAGLALMWAGVAALGVYTIVVYLKLRRH